MKGQKDLSFAIFNFELAAKDLREFRDVESLNIDGMRHRAWIAEGDVLQGLRSLRKFMRVKNGKKKKD